jgi:hypothetical protein
MARPRLELGTAIAETIRSVQAIAFALGTRATQTRELRSIESWL